MPWFLLFELADTMVGLQWELQKPHRKRCFLFVAGNCHVRVQLHSPKYRFHILWYKLLNGIYAELKRRISIYAYMMKTTYEIRPFHLILSPDTDVASMLTFRSKPICPNGSTLAVWYHTSVTTASRFWAGMIIQCAAYAWHCRVDTFCTQHTREHALAME